MYAQEKKAKPKLRLLGAIQRKQEKSIDEIAYVLNTPRDTVYGWLWRFTRRGVGAKDSIKQTGRPTELRAYPNRPVALHVITPHAMCSIAK